MKLLIHRSRRHTLTNLHMHIYMMNNTTEHESICGMSAPSDDVQQYRSNKTDSSTDDICT